MSRQMRKRRIQIQELCCNENNCSESIVYIDRGFATFRWLQTIVPSNLLSSFPFCQFQIAQSVFDESFFRYVYDEINKMINQKQA